MREPTTCVTLGTLSNRRVGQEENVLTVGGVAKLSSLCVCSYSWTIFQVQQRQSFVLFQEVVFFCNGFITRMFGVEPAKVEAVTFLRHLSSCSVSWDLQTFTEISSETTALSPLPSPSWHHLRSPSVGPMLQTLPSRLWRTVSALKTYFKVLVSDAEVWAVLSQWTADDHWQ